MNGKVTKWVIIAAGVVIVTLLIVYNFTRTKPLDPNAGINPIGEKMGVKIK